MWTPECQTAFETLVKSVTSDSVIAVPDFSEEFILKTDASLIAIGCVLQQIQEGLTKVISFNSKKLTDRQSSWVVFDCEFFSLFVPYKSGENVWEFQPHSKLGRPLHCG